MIDPAEALVSVALNLWRQERRRPQRTQPLGLEEFSVPAPLAPDPLESLDLSMNASLTHDQVCMFISHSHRLQRINLCGTQANRWTLNELQRVCGQLQLADMRRTDLARERGINPAAYPFVLQLN